MTGHHMPRGALGCKATSKPMSKAAGKAASKAAGKAKVRHPMAHEALPALREPAPSLLPAPPAVLSVPTTHTATAAHGPSAGPAGPGPAATTMVKAGAKTDSLIADPDLGATKTQGRWVLA